MFGHFGTKARQSLTTVVTRKMASAPTLKMNNGRHIPMFGLGTWKSEPGQVEQAVKDAIDIGYRHIDGAYFYFNETEVGAGIRTKIDEGKVKREDIFYTGKLWNTFHRPDLVEPAVKKTLKDLGLEYVDLYLIHWPTAFKEGGEVFPLDENGKVMFSDVDYVDTWKAMEKILEKGYAKSIGVSNFNSQQLERLLSKSSVLPVTNQFECHPYLNQKKLVEFCKSKNIVVTSYSPFGSTDRPWADPNEPKLLEDPRLIKVGKKYNKTPAQVILRWLTQRDIIVIPKSVNKERLVQNFNIFDFQLTSDDMEVVFGLNRNWRAVALPQVADHKNYPFKIEF